MGKNKKKYFCKIEGCKNQIDSRTALKGLGFCKSHSIREIKNRPKVKEKISESLSKVQKERYKNVEERKKTGKAIKKALNSPKGKKNKKEAQEKLWNNSNYKRNQIELIKKACNTEVFLRKLSLALGGTGIPYENNPLAGMIRVSLQYRNWRRVVFERDNYTCQNPDCGAKSSKYRRVCLNVHHIKPFIILLKNFLKKYKNLSPIYDKLQLFKSAKIYKPFWDIENGITYCKKCHYKIKHTNRTNQLE